MMGENEIKTIDAVYDEKTKKTNAVCPFCGNKADISTRDCKGSCEHLAYWYTSNHLNMKLPKSVLSWIVRNPEAMTKWHDECTEWYWETFLPYYWYVDDESWDDEGSYDPSDHYNPETDSYEHIDFEGDGPGDGWYVFWNEGEYSEFTAEDLHKVLTGMGYDELAGKMVVAEGKSKDCETTFNCYAVYLPEMPKEK